MWARYESVAMVRLPTFEMRPVPADQARAVLREGPAAVLSFLMEPDEAHPPNGWLYLCRDRAYSLETLKKEARRDARRALRSLRIEPMDWKALLAHGHGAYGDTRTRVGLSDGTAAHFARRFEPYASIPGHYAVGAWKGATLVAFLTLIVVDDWVVIEGCFSRNEDRDLCPNNGLAHVVLEHFLANAGCATVCYGASSIQDTVMKGYHFYKTRIGFDAVPVHRAFVLHPWLRPFANPATLWSLKAALRWKPSDRHLLKAIGVVTQCLESAGGRA
jgi:hypothetical protein